MSCMQANASQFAFNFTSINQSLSTPYMPCINTAHFGGLRKTTLKPSNTASANQSGRLFDTSLKLRTGASRYLRCAPVCLFGGKGKPERENEASPWSALEKAMGSLKKEPSIEDLLRQQIEKNEYFDDGGSGGSSSGGGGDNSGGSEDESGDGILDEVLQVVLATVGFIFLYIYIIDGEDMTRMAKDYIKFIFSGKKSIRLNRAMYQWGRFYQRLIRKKEVNPYWLEEAIFNTPTWFDSPTKYKRIVSAYLASTSNE